MKLTSSRRQLVDTQFGYHLGVWAVVSSPVGEWMIADQLNFLVVESCVLFVEVLVQSLLGDHQWWWGLVGFHQL